MRSELSIAFQRFCHRFFRGVFYKQGNFISFGQEEEASFLEEIAESCGEEFAEQVRRSTAILAERGLGGTFPVDISERQRAINRFRRLLGSLFFSHELVRQPTIDEESLADRWFAPPPYWLLRYYETQPKLAKHLKKINPVLLRFAERESATASSFSLREEVEHEFGPHLFLLHFLFWRDDASKAKLDPKGKKKPSLEDCRDAVELKAAHSAEVLSEELDKLLAELREPVPRGVNSLIFHFLSWIAWSEPPLLSDPEGPTGHRPNPGFEPMKHFIEQAAGFRARKSWRALSKQGRTSRTEEDLKHDLVIKVLVMFRNDQLRSAINLNAKINTILQHEAQRLARIEMDAAAARVDTQDQRHLDRLAQRQESALGDRFRANLDSPDAKARFQEFIDRSWEVLRHQITEHLEEMSPERIHLPTELKELVTRERPELFAILPEVSPCALMRWYYLEALGVEGDQLRQELRVQRHALSDSQHNIWLDELDEDHSIGLQRRLLDEAITSQIDHWLEQSDPGRGGS